MGRQKRYPAIKRVYEVIVAAAIGVAMAPASSSAKPENHSGSAQSGALLVDVVEGFNWGVTSASWSTLNPSDGPGGSEKGDAWVMGDGCPVRLILDDEMHNKNGSLLEKVHYEEEMVKQ
jgi:hypothetical protein